MATISSSIRLVDNVTPAFQSMLKSMHTTISSFEMLNTATGNCINSKAMAANLAVARSELTNAGAAIKSWAEDIESAKNSQNNLGNAMKNNGSVIDTMSGKIKGLVATVGAYVGVNKLLDMSDTYSQTTARVNLMNDGLQTTEVLQDSIYQAALNSHGAYQSTADAVSKLGIMAGSAFSSSSEIVDFAEQLNKQFVIGGTNVQGQEAAMLQLTQAMASGVLRGDELNSVYENAPLLIQSMADYMGVPVEQMRSLAEQGLITTDVMKNGVLNAADQTNARFASMGVTFGQVWTDFKTKATKAWQTVNKGLNDLANSPGLALFFDNVVSGIENLTPIIATVVGSITDMFNDPGVQNFITGIIQGFTQIIGVVAQSVPPVLNFIGSFAGIDGIANAFTVLVGGVLAFKAATAGISGISAISTLVTGLTGTGAAAGASTGAFAGLGATIGAISAPVVMVIAGVTALTAVIVGAWQASETFRDAVGTAFEDVKNTALTAFGSVQAAFEPVIQSFHGFGTAATPVLQEVGDFLGNYVVPAIQWFTETFLASLSSILIALAPAFTAIGNLFSFVGDGIGLVCALFNGDWNTAWMMAGSMVQNAKDFIVNTVTALYQCVSTILQGTWDAVTWSFTGIFGTVSVIGQSIYEAGTNAFWSLVNGTAEVLGNLYGTVTGGFQAALDFVAGLPGQFFQWGLDMIQNMIDGISDTKNLVTAVEGIVADVIARFKSGFGIQSPSKEMYKIGSFLMDGLVNAMTNSDIASFCASMVEDIKAAFSGGNFNLASALSWLGTGAEDILKAIGITIPQLNSLVGGFIWPTNSTEITSGFGYRSDEETGGVGSNWHEGIDIGAAYGDAVAAAAAGVVELAGWNGGYGNCVMIDHGNGLETLYGHLSEIEVAAGQMVSAGQEIGKVGSTGNSTGPHLHFGVYQNGEAIDPMTANFGGASSGGDLASWINQAMSIVGVSGADNFNHLYQLAMAESSGDPNAINNWDSNAAAGTPSMGLMQTIQSTFDAYSLGGSIWDPVSNAVAAIRYMIDVYGSILNTPLTGYATGTNFATRGLHLVGEKGPELVNFGGGEKVLTADKTSQIMDSARSGSKESKDGKAPVISLNIQFTGDNIINDDTDIKTIAHKLGSYLKEEIATSPAGVY